VEYGSKNEIVVKLTLSAVVLAHSAQHITYVFMIPYALLAKESTRLFKTYASPIQYAGLKVSIQKQIYVVRLPTPYQTYALMEHTMKAQEVAR